MCNEVAAAVCGGHAVASDPFCAPFDLSPAIWASGSRRCHLRQDGCTATTIVAIQRIRNDYGLIESESRYRTTLILIKNLDMGADPDTRQTRRTPLDRHTDASQLCSAFSCIEFVQIRCTKKRCIIQARNLGLELTLDLDLLC